MSCGIYKITNIVNGKPYIGQSVTIEKRWKKHLNSKDDCLIHIAIRKYGISSFKFEILEECPPEMLDEREQWHIHNENSISPNGYNLTSGGGRCSFYSDESRKKMSESAKGNTSHKGYHHTDETRKIISEASRGNTSHKGFHHSEDAKRKMSEAKRGKVGNRMGKIVEKIKWITPDGEIKYMSKGKARVHHPDWKEYDNK